MAFKIGNNTVIHDTDATAAIVTNSDLDVLQINGTDVLVHDGSTITLKNVDIADLTEASINTDNVAEGSTNLFFTDARAVSALASTTSALAADIVTNTSAIALNTGNINTKLPLAGGTLTGALTLSGAPTNANHASTKAYVDASISSGTGGLDTDDIPEAGNLYYTQARADARVDAGFTAKSTTDLSEGTNLYYTDARVGSYLSTNNFSTEAYADQAEADAVTTANAYTDTRETAITSAYQSYADQAEVDAKAYTDTRETAITSAYQSYADQAEVDAKAYTDTRETAITSAYQSYADQVEVDAKAYTDTRETAITTAYESYADTAESDAVTTANAYTDTEVANLVDGAPGTLDTLNELAAALGDDANLSTTLSTQIGTKVAKAGDTMTGALTLSGAPSSANHAATKAYVDSAVSGGTGGLDTDDIPEAGNLYYTDARAQAVSINNLVEDTTPQLGGNLDLNGKNITSTSNDFEINLGTGADLTSIGIGGLTETGMTGGGIGIASSTNAGSDVVVLGDLDFTSGGIVTGELIGMWAFDNATSLSSNVGLALVTLNGTNQMVGCTLSDSASVIFGNLGTANEVGLAVGTNSDARIHQLDSSGNTIFKLPAADGSANQVLKTDGNGDLSWVAQTSNTNTTYTAGTGLNLVGTTFNNTAPDQTVSLTGSGATSISGTYPNFTISSTDTNTDTNTTYTAGNGLTLTGTEFKMSGSYTGDFTASGDVTAYSDERLKSNITTIEDALSKVNAMRGVMFDKTDSLSGELKASTGVIAQEVEEVLPEVVHNDSNTGYKSVAYGNIVGVLIEAIKEQQLQIKELKDDIEFLKGKR